MMRFLMDLAQKRTTCLVRHREGYLGNGVGDKVERER